MDENMRILAVLRIFLALLRAEREQFEIDEGRIQLKKREFSETIHAEKKIRENRLTQDKIMIEGRSGK